jgi:hypothetical protein
MKKKMIAMIAGSIYMLLTLATLIYAASDIKLFINGERIAIPIEIKEGSTYVPLRVVSEALGAQVHWDESSREIQIHGSYHTIAILLMHKFIMDR